jgi:hypothetical protein
VGVQRGCSDRAPAFSTQDYKRAPVEHVTAAIKFLGTCSTL